MMTDSRFPAAVLCFWTLLSLASLLSAQQPGRESERRPGRETLVLEWHRAMIGA